MDVSIDDVRDAAARIRGHVHRTPVLTSRTLNEELGAEIYCKAENLQKVGAFKARGACNFVWSLSDEEAKKGVVTHSSGNHAAAVAYACGLRGISCTVVMPESAAPIKKQAVKGYGAQIVECPEGTRLEACAEEQQRTGAVMIPPYDHPRIVAGQATAALELIEEVGDLDVVIAPVGGGGLLAGTAVTVHALCPQARILGAEPEAVDDAFRSLRDGTRYPAVQNPQTRGDGLLTGLGELNFAILSELGVQVITVSEEAMLVACRFHLLRMKTLVEPSGGTALAAARSLPDLAGKRVGLILSGGNTDLAWLAESSS